MAYVMLIKLFEIVIYLCKLFYCFTVTVHVLLLMICFYACIPLFFLFTITILTLHAATNLFKLLLKYRPEDRAAKKERLLKRAQAESEGKTVEAKKPIVVKYGLNHITYLIEQVA